MLAVLLGVLAAGFGVWTAVGFGASTPSAPTILTKPSNPSNQTSPTFGFSAPPAGVTNQCKLDLAAFGACTTPTTYSTGALGQGSHTFQVRARNNGDGKTSSAASYTWVVDTTPPAAPVVTSGPTALPGWSTTTAAHFVWTGESGASFVCKLDGVDAACSSGVTFTVGQGAHTFSVKATDAAGNTGPFSSPLYQWRVDSIAPPAPVITTRPDDPNGSAISIFEWTESEGGVTFQCSLENGAFQACVSGVTYIVDVSNNGLHQFAVRAVDAAGNVSSTAFWSWKVDPSVHFTITGNAAGTLYPGGPWVPLALSIVNQNNWPIIITGLAVTVSMSPSGCPSGANVEVQQSSASPSSTFTVPANATTAVPNAFRPLIRLRNTASNQDPCKNQTFSLAYSGTATK